MNIEIKRNSIIMSKLICFFSFFVVNKIRIEQISVSYTIKLICFLCSSLEALILDTKLPCSFKIKIIDTTKNQTKRKLINWQPLAYYVSLWLLLKPLCMISSHEFHFLSEVLHILLSETYIKLSTRTRRT